jgi:hypothetical protein
MNTTKALKQLSADLDEVLFRSKSEDEESAPSGRKVAANTAAGALVGGGIAAGGLAYGHSKVMKNYRNGGAPFAKDGGLIQTGAEGVDRAYKQAGKDIKAGVGSLVNKGKAKAGVLANRAKDYGKGVLGEAKKAGGYFRSARAGAAEGLGEGVAGALKSAGKRALRGVSKVKFGSKVARKLIELDAKTDELTKLRKNRTSR